MARKSSIEKKNSLRIEKLYYARCNGVQIDIMDIGKVFAEGEKGIREGLDDQALGDRIEKYVETIRKN